MHDWPPHPALCSLARSYGMAECSKPPGLRPPAAFTARSLPGMSSYRPTPVLLNSLAAPARAGCDIVHGDVSTSNVLLQRCITAQGRRNSLSPTLLDAANATSPPTAALAVPQSPWEPSSQSGDTAAAPSAGQRNESVLDHNATTQDTGNALLPTPGPGSSSQEAVAAMHRTTQRTATRPLREALPPAEGATGAYLQPDIAYATGGGGGGSTMLSSSCLAAATGSSLSTLLQPGQQGEVPTFQQGKTLQQLEPSRAAAPGVTGNDWDQHPLRDVAPVAAPAPEATWQPLPGVNVSPGAGAALRAASGVGWTEELRAPQLDPLDKLRAALGLGFKAKVGGWWL